jgi:hypothetical protein
MTRENLVGSYRYSEHELGSTSPGIRLQQLRGICLTDPCPRTSEGQLRAHLYLPLRVE